MDSVNQQLIIKFYKAFQNKDYKTMQDCYADNATFSDPVFVNLNATQVRAMWEMLCVRGKDLELTFKNVTATVGNQASAEWEAHYTFSASNRKVINQIKAAFLIENGKIVKHVDTFSFYKWSKQALGTGGLLLGWTRLLKNKVRQGAMKSLTDFMNKKQINS
ncbi:MAG: nuclear transport factor 2 family protein [Bacteroidia bacterium]